MSSPNQKIRIPGLGLRLDMVSHEHRLEYWLECECPLKRQPWQLA